MDKAALRAMYLGVREGLSEARVAEGSAALCRRLATMTVVREAETILAYLAFGNEVDVSGLFELLPDKGWVVPRIEGKRLILHPYELEGLVRHRFGMLEPPADAPVVDPKKVDLVLVPGVSFDRCGGRVGFGGGFYDRFLVRTSAVRIGVCDDACTVDACPVSDYDQRMDWVVTPTMAVHCAPLWRRGEVGDAPDSALWTGEGMAAGT
jgi:5-formyltetrahydrofolate cyclo-ligase